MLIGRISCTVVSAGRMRIQGACVVAAAGASVSSEGGGAVRESHRRGQPGNC